jgi:hypothetical protein
MVTFLLIIVLIFFISATPFFVVLCRIIFQVQSASRTTFLQKGENDEDMTPVHTTMIGACNGVEEVQQGWSSWGVGKRLIRFESPRWRLEAIQVRAQFDV